MKVRDQKGWAIEVDEYQKVVDAIDNLSKSSADRSQKQYEAVVMMVSKLAEANQKNSEKIAKAIESSSAVMAGIADSLKALAEKENSESYGEELTLLVKEISTLRPTIAPVPSYEFTISRDRNGYLSSVSATPKNTLN